MEWDLAVLWEQYLLPWGTQIVSALLVFIIGRFVVGWVVKGVSRMMHVAKMDEILVGFLSAVLKSALVVVVIIIALSQLGVDTTSMVALLGAAGLAVGLALKDSLTHFAAGVMLILFKLIKLGDYVEVDGVAGKVSKITIFNTKLTTPDNRVVTVPNGNVFGNTLTNYNEEKTRRIDLVIGISYDSDLRKALQILKDIIGGHEKILKDPEPIVRGAELADSSVNIVVRPWVNAEDYWEVYWDLIETIKITFDEQGIGIPFPQMDVHVQEIKSIS
jgi:small conductance mechanosensitive channel